MGAADADDARVVHLFGENHHVRRALHNLIEIS